MEERKSMGGALVDVFDAGLTLVKSEINAVARKAGQIVLAGSFTRPVAAKAGDLFEADYGPLGQMTFKFV